MRNGQDVSFRGEIEFIGSYVSASYRLVLSPRADGSIRGDTRIFSSRITAKAWLEEEARRRGFASYRLGDASVPVGGDPIPV